MTIASIVVILPCYNEASAIAGVVKDFRKALPQARIYVFDNNSTDNTVSEAKAAGAHVRHVRAQGKGNVIRQAFAVLDADIYIIADGDGTYEAARAPQLVQRLISDDLDMVIGVRRHTETKAYRLGHVMGNKMFNRVVRFMFASQIADIFSGYRVFSRPFVKSFPALATGFETETELTLHAVELKLPFAEVETAYGVRKQGGESKLNTLRDGARILTFMFKLLKYIRPLFMFTVIALVWTALSLVIGVPVIIEFMQTGLVPRLPSAVAAAGLMIIAAVSLVTGVLLDSIAHAQRERKRLAYLAVKRRNLHENEHAEKGHDPSGPVMAS